MLGAGPGDPGWACAPAVREIPSSRSRKALLDLMGKPMLERPAAALLAGASCSGARSPALPEILRGALHSARRRSRCSAGRSQARIVTATAAISWALSAGFWAGALPSLAVFVEMNERAPAGTFLRLAGTGFARVSGSSAIGTLLSLLVGLTIAFSRILFGVPLFFVHPTVPLAAALAAVFTCSIGTGFLVDLLANLSLIRAAVLGDSPATPSCARPAVRRTPRLGARHRAGISASGSLARDRDRRLRRPALHLRLNRRHRHFFDRPARRHLDRHHRRPRLGRARAEGCARGARRRRRGSAHAPARTCRLRSRGRTQRLAPCKPGSSARRGSRCSRSLRKSRAPIKSRSSTRSQSPKRRKRK